MAAGAAGLARGVAALIGTATAPRPAEGLAPRFQVDPRWPKPLPRA